MIGPSDIDQYQMTQLIQIVKDLYTMVVWYLFFILLCIGMLTYKLGIIATRTYDLVQKISNIWNRYSTK